MTPGRAIGSVFFSGGQPATWAWLLIATSLAALALAAAVATRR